MENIVTHEELKQTEGIPLPSDKKEPTKKKKKEPVKVKFECPYAPMGNAKTVIKFKQPSKKQKDIIYEISLENKIYVLPDNLSEDEGKMLREALKQNGFRDVTKNKSGVKYDKKKQKYTYSVIHPDHSELRPINGNISLPMVDERNEPKNDKNGKQIFKQVSIVNGIVTVDDEKIYEALLRAGFYSGHKKVRE